MRYLLILGLLAVTCSAFAADITSASATGVVSLTVEKYVAISDAPAQSITISGNGASGTATLVFPFVCNTPATITPAITASTSGTGAVWSLGSGAVAGAAPGGNASVVVNVGNGGVQLLAGNDSCTVTATITAP